MRLTDLHYDLPPEAIAQRPADRRDASRLMVVDRSSPADPRPDVPFAAFADQLRGDELLVLNDTRVLPARLRAHKPSGGAVELLITDALTRPIHAMARSSKALKVGTELVLDGAGPAETAHLTVLEVLGGGHYALAPRSDDFDLMAILAEHGELPLPPYIDRPEGPDASDLERYQTVFAASPGAVAAPTAGLHFTDGLLDDLRSRGHRIATVTLHVGPGTFLPIRSDDVDGHVMHGERYEIPPATIAAIQGARAEGRPVLAVGTTTVRALEGCVAAHGELVAGPGETRLFIRPGFGFQVVDQLLTNFHLPGSTLLLLVSALAGAAGLDLILAAYRDALARGMRFYSYGDAMLLR